MKAGSIPPPPHPNAEYLSMNDCAGLLGITRRFWNHLRGSDETLPLPFKLTKGTLRMPRRELIAWVEQRERGWASRGGRRRRRSFRALVADQPKAV
jgi:predicted DNA-binding transcriptional regulator AlpA